MSRTRVITIASVVLAVFALGACTDNPPPPPTQIHHVTIWQLDVAHPDTAPDITSWNGFGTFLYNDGGPCVTLDGGGGWTQTFVRLDAATVRVTITLDWIEGSNDGSGFFCGVNEDLNVGLVDTTGVQVAFAVVPLLSHT